MDNTNFFQSRVTKTAAFTGAAIDVSMITGDFTVFLRVVQLLGSGTVRFRFGDSLDSFVADNMPGPTYSMRGNINNDVSTGGSVTKSFLRRDFPSLRMGTAAAKLRLDVAELTGDATKSVTYEAWIQYAS